jgi:DNA repair protein RecN (Recombination protein N)
MLRRLHIRNYLLMEELDLPLHKGLSIITGETGSGKSIIIGALGLAMGERAETSVLRDPEKRCIIELEAALEGLGLEDWFSAAELPYESTALLRRQLEPNGRSRAFINDTPVRLEQLRELGAHLVHVHSQHHTLLLNNARFQLGLLDHAAGQAAQVARYGTIHRRWLAVQRELALLKDAAARSGAELEFLRFQIDELSAAALLPDEQAGLEQDLLRAEHSDELVQALAAVGEGVEGDRGALEIVAKLRQTLSRAARMDTGVKALMDRLESVQIELKDIGAEAGSLASSVEVDPAQAMKLQERLDLLLRLQQKHRVRSNSELIALHHQLVERAAGMEMQEERIPQLEQEEALLREQVLGTAAALSKGRLKAGRELARKVERILHELGMEQAVFQFEQRTLETPGPQGLDALRALFSANKDRAAAPLDKIASGGELSRVMLAIISLTADSQDLPTVIFDEIDTGVSGEVADRVGTRMAQMARDRQVIAITHLPQIASKAAHHMLVAREARTAGSRSTITLLDPEQRVEAIAQMLSGRKLSKAALENARVLLDQR